MPSISYTVTVTWSLWTGKQDFSFTIRDDAEAFDAAAKLCVEYVSSTKNYS